MLLTKPRLIFIHIPKTAGNAIQSLLVPLSDDEVLPIDGVNRFEVVGTSTRKKHQTLREYAERFDVNNHVIATSCRHPVARLVSYYFSPHRWARGSDDGKIVYETPYWARDGFLRDLPTPAVDYLRVGGQVKHPDHLIRFETLPTSVASFLRECGIPCRRDLQVLNRSKAPSAIVAQVLRDPFVTDVALANYREDFDAFGYAHP